MGDSIYFQDYLPGKTCFGCGTENHHGLHIKSYWEGDDAVCQWQPTQYHEGWMGLTCGGIIATVVDCHCIATAMATAYRNEDRPLGSEPVFLFVTGQLDIKYLQPAHTTDALRVVARVAEIKLEKKYTVTCEVYSGGTQTAQAKVIALLAYRSDRPTEGNPLFIPKSRG